MRLVLIAIMVVGCLSITGARADEEGVDVGLEPAVPKPRSMALLPESPLHWGLDLLVLYKTYPRYVYPTSGITSTQGGWGFQAGFEWLPVTEYGKIGFGVSAGVFRIGNVEQPDGGAASLLVIPVSAYLSYRIDVLPNQIVVPFVRMGPQLSFSNQRSNFAAHDQSDFKSFKGLDIAIGGEFLLDLLEPRTAVKMDQAHGINSSYLVFEYVISQALGTSGVQPDLSSTGEMRVGLRLEI